MSTETDKLIDEFTDEELDILTKEITCKRDMVTGDIKCTIPEEYEKALAKAKNQPKRIVFEVIPPENLVKESLSGHEKS